MKQVLHLDLHVEDELSAVEELPQAGLRVKLLSRDIYIDLFSDFLKLSDPCVLHEAVGWGAVEPARRHAVRRGRDRQRVFAVLEDQADYIVDRVDGFVDLVRLQNGAVRLVPPFVVDLHFLPQIARLLLSFFGLLLDWTLLGWLYLVVLTRRAVQGRGRRRLRGQAGVRRFVCCTANSYTLMLLAFLLRHKALMSYDSRSVQSDRLN